MDTMNEIYIFAAVSGSLVCVYLCLGLMKRLCYIPETKLSTVVGDEALSKILGDYDKEDGQHTD